MENFRGFTEQTKDFLVGIKFNNNKEWFNSNKLMYTENVHKPIVALANEVYEKMHEYRKNFNEKPKISRINRDIRFSNNKSPYKISKWFFLRGDGSPHIRYEKPTYFFEMSGDWWRYGLFYAPTPTGMEKYRNKISADLPAFERLVNKYDRNKKFELYGEMYKRIFNKDLSDKINNWANRKEIELIHYEDYGNLDFYNSELVNIIYNSFKELYPLYEYLNTIG